MPTLKKSSAPAIDMVFILALFALFGITSFFVIMFGARQYQNIANGMSDNYETRTVSSYLEEKLNQSDLASSHSIVTLDGVDALALTRQVADKSYTTYIYAYDGYLWEITVSSDTVVTLGSGQKVIESSDIFMKKLSSRLYQFTITSTEGETSVLYESFNSK